MEYWYREDEAQTTTANQFIPDLTRGVLVRPVRLLAVLTAAVSFGILDVRRSVHDVFLVLIIILTLSILSIIIIDIYLYTIQRSNTEKESLKE